MFGVVDVPVPVVPVVVVVPVVPVVEVVVATVPPWLAAYPYGPAKVAFVTEQN